MSRILLGNIFGHISFLSLSDIKSPIGELMRIFNLGILMFAGGYATYTVSTSAINFSKHAGPMEAEQHNAWLPARIFIGAGALIPTLSGYSMVQVIIMWSVLQGVGLADYIWNQMSSQLDRYGVVPHVIDNSAQLYSKLYAHGADVENDVMPGSASLKQMLASVKCAQLKNKESDEKIALSEGENYIRIGNKNNAKLCGEYTFTPETNKVKELFKNFYNSFNVISDSNEIDPLLIKQAFEINYTLLYQYAKEFFKAKVIAKKENEDDWANVAKKQGWVSAGLNYFRFTKKDSEASKLYKVDDISLIFPSLTTEFTIGDKINNFCFTAQKAFNEARDSYNFNQDEKQPAKSDGQLDNTMNFVAEQASKYFDGLNSIHPNSTTFSEHSNINSPGLNWLFYITNIFGLKDLNDTPTNLTVVRDQSLVLNAKIAQTLLGINLINDEDWYEPAKPKENQSNLFHMQCRQGYKNCLTQGAGIIYGVDKFLKGERVEPLVATRKLGIKLMNHSVAFWNKIAEGVYITSRKLVIRYGYLVMMFKLAAAGLAGIASFISMGLIGDILSMLMKTIDGIIDLLFTLDQKSMVAFLPFSGSISVIYFLAGAVLGIYLPFIPFIVFIFSVIGWVITVIEAMIAGPLIALGVTHPQGHDLLGKSEQAMMLILGVFVRPAAIMIGFVAALYVLYIAYTLLNVGFLVAIAGYLQGTTITEGIIMKSVLFMSILLMYVYILSAVVHQVFGLTYKVPEQLMRWIGLSPEISGASQMLGEVSQSVQSGFNQSAEGAKQSASQLPQMRFKSDRSLDRKIKEIAKNKRSIGKKKQQTAEAKTESKGSGDDA